MTAFSSGFFATDALVNVFQGPLDVLLSWFIARRTAKESGSLAKSA
jgi:hypothetical protein